MSWFNFEVANDENWGHIHKIRRVKANTLKGAFKKANQIINKAKGEEIYQVTKGRVKQGKRKYWQCKMVYDFFNGLHIY